MNTAEFVAALVKEQKEHGIDPQQIVWNAALACIVTVGDPAPKKT